MLNSLPTPSGRRRTRRLIPSLVAIAAVAGIALQMWYGGQHAIALTLIGAVAFLLLDLHWRARNWAIRRARSTANDFLAAVVDSTSDAIVVTELDGRIIRWGKGAEAAYGYSAREMVGEHILRIIPPDDVPRFSAGLVEARAGLKPRYEARRMRKDGSVVDMEITVSPIRDEHGSVVYLAGIARDITGRRRADDELRQRAHDYRLLFDENPHAMWVFDAETLHFLDVNAAAQRQYGWTRDEFLGMTIADIRPAEDMPRLREQLGRTPEVPRSGTWRHRRKDGSLIDVEVSTEPVAFGGRRARMVLVTDITDRVRAESALRQNQELLANAEELAHVGSWSYDFASGAMHWTPEMFRMAALPVSGVAPGLDACLALVDAADLPAIEAAIESLHSCGMAEVEFTIRLGDGVRRTLRASARVHHDPEARVHRVMGSAQDITERLAAARAYQQADATLSTLFRDSPLAILTLDRRSRVTSWNPAAQRIFGWTKAEVIGKPLPTIPRDMAADFQRGRMAELAGDAVLMLETRAVAKNGTELDIQISTAPIRDGDGNVIGSVGIIADITERKRVERQLRASEERWRLISKSTNDVMYDWDIPGNAVRWGENVGPAFRYAPDAILETYEWWAERIHPDDLAQIDRDMHEALAGEFTSWTGEYRFRRGDGTYAAVLDRSYIVRDETGKPVRLLGSMIDMTERQSLEQQLRHSQKMEAVGQLAGGIAHDFNNLLTVIGVNCGLMLDAVPAHSPLVTDLQEIAGAARRAGALTRQLLAFSRKQVLKLEIFGINEVIADSERMLRRLIPESIELRTDFAPSAGRIEADRGQLEQVLMNLVVNARDAMPSGGAITIATGERAIRANDMLFPRLKPGRYVTLAVHDNGHGMDAETQRRIFEPFFTTKATGQGTGLGLSTVYGIAEQLGGSIAVESAPGAGARFTIALPRTMSEAESVEKPEAPAGASGHAGSVVLLVEDETAVRSIACRLLEKDGHRVLIARDGGEAIEVAQRYHGTIDVLLTDLVMPVMGGREVASAIRNAYPAIRVLFMTGYSEDAVTEPGALAQAVRIIEKPFNAEGLLRAVREELEEGRLSLAF